MRAALRAFVLSVLFASLSGAQAVGSFEVVFDDSSFDERFGGAVLIAFAKPGEAEPRRRMHAWFNAPPVLRFDLEGMTPGRTVTLVAEDAARRHPVDWAEVERGEWTVQAIARLSRTGRQAGLSEGDVHSAAVEIEYDPEADGTVRLALDTVVPAEPVVETPRFRSFEHESRALTEFHGFPYPVRAGVLLPREWREGERYPMVVSVTGFGGTWKDAARWESRIDEGSPLENALIVVPDANNLYGHSVFCDSPSIGPWGHALVHELLPAIEAKFGGAGPEHRYVTGVSSGGWSSLWLQVAYPDAFAGCWSHVPDPMDFHDFQQIDLYQPLPDGSPRNMYVDEEGDERPLARRGDVVMLTYRDFVQREHVLNPGGQIRSFEATFGPLGPDGTPRRVFDVETGEIDHEAARAWREFDISHRLLTGWDELRDSLAGKIRIYAGEVDTFYLEGAVERFRGLAEEAGMLEDMTVEVVPGMAHDLHRPGARDMAETVGARWSARVGGDSQVPQR